MKHTINGIVCDTEKAILIASNHYSGSYLSVSEVYFNGKEFFRHTESGDTRKIEYHSESIELMEEDDVIDFILDVFSRELSCGSTCLDNGFLRKLLLKGLSRQLCNLQECIDEAYYQVHKISHELQGG